jgi:hypothetical protein
MRFEGLLIIKSLKGKYAFKSGIPVKCLRIFSRFGIGICIVKYSQSKNEIVDCETELAKNIVNYLGNELKG